MGIERLLLACDAEGSFLGPTAKNSGVGRTSQMVHQLET